MPIPLNSLSPPNFNLGAGRDVGPKNREGGDFDLRSLVADQRKSASAARVAGNDLKKEEISRENLPMNSRKSMSRKNSLQNNEKEELGSQSGVRDSKPESRKVQKNKDTRNSAVQKLMDSLESELGISAERFSAALAQLPSAVKSMSIEDSAPYIMEELGIPRGEASAMAEKAYLELLHQSQSMGQEQDPSLEGSARFFAKGEAMKNGESPVIPSSMSELMEAQPPSASALTAKMTQRQNLNATIDALNRKFFDIQQKQADLSLQAKQAELALMNGNNDQSASHLMESPQPNALSLFDEMPVSKNFEAESEVQSLVKPPFGPRSDEVFRDENIVEGETGFIESDSAPYSSKALSAFSLKTPSEEALASKILENQNLTKNPNAERSAQSDEARFSSLNDLEKILSSNQDLVSFEMEDPGLKGSLRAENQRIWTVEELPFLTQGEGAMQSISASSLKDDGAHFNEPGNSFLTEFEQASHSNSQDSLDDLLNEFSLSPEQNRMGVNNSLQGNKVNAAGANDGLLSSQLRANNIERLSTAAESLAARGGGEVKVVLAPEGLGSIQLKVSVIEGRVQVEMKAENQNSQKALESGLADLRNSLASHNLTVDSVKVDVGQDYSQRDREQSQAFSQSQPDLGRDQARQFMNQFREQNAFQRQSLFEAPGFKSYRNRSEESLGPISQEVRPRSSLNVNKGRDLNLVV